VYIPEHFQFDDPDLQLAHMQRYAFATLVAELDGSLEISHVPLISELTPTGLCLFGHVARKNRLHQASKATAVFLGPHAYISANWYGQPEMVPTWHYLTIHAHGTLTPIENPLEQRQLFTRLGQIYDGNDATRWWQQLSPSMYEGFRQAIVWFRIDVQHVSAKAKLGQDDLPAGRQRVISALRSAGNTDQIAIADAMARTLLA
jgi:transcriptional regulator